MNVNWVKERCHSAYLPFLETMGSYGWYPIPEGQLNKKHDIAILFGNVDYDFSSRAVDQLLSSLDENWLYAHKAIMSNAWRSGDQLQVNRFVVIFRKQQQRSERLERAHQNWLKMIKAEACLMLETEAHTSATTRPSTFDTQL